MAVAAVTATALVLSAAGRGSVGAALDRSPAADRVVDVSGELATTDPTRPTSAPREALSAADRAGPRPAGRGAGARPWTGPRSAVPSGDGSGAGVVTRRVLGSSYVVPGPSPGDARTPGRRGRLRGARASTRPSSRARGPVRSTRPTPAAHRGRRPRAGGGRSRARPRRRGEADQHPGRLGPRPAADRHLPAPRTSGRATGSATPLGVTRRRPGQQLRHLRSVPGRRRVRRRVVADPALTWRADPALDGLAPRAGRRPPPWPGAAAGRGRRRDRAGGARPWRRGRTARTARRRSGRRTR